MPALESFRNSTSQNSQLPTNMADHGLQSPTPHSTCRFLFVGILIMHTSNHTLTLQYTYCTQTLTMTLCEVKLSVLWPDLPMLLFQWLLFRFMISPCFLVFAFWIWPLYCCLLIIWLFFYLSMFMTLLHVLELFPSFNKDSKLQLHPSPTLLHDRSIYIKQCVQEIEKKWVKERFQTQCQN